MLKDSLKWFRSLHSEKNHTAALINTLNGLPREPPEILDLVNHVWTINLFNLFTSAELIKNQVIKIVP